MVQWFQTLELPLQGVQVQSLVGELRSHMPPGMDQGKKKSCRCVLKYKFNKVFDHVLIHKLSFLKTFYIVLIGLFKKKVQCVFHKENVSFNCLGK